MYELAAIIRALFTGELFARAEVYNYRPPNNLGGYDMNPGAPDSYREYDPKGSDHGEITDIGPVWQNR